MQNPLPGGGPVTLDPHSRWSGSSTAIATPSRTGPDRESLRSTNRWLDRTQRRGRLGGRAELPGLGRRSVSATEARRRQQPPLLEIALKVLADQPSLGDFPPTSGGNQRLEPYPPPTFGRDSWRRWGICFLVTGAGLLVVLAVAVTWPSPAGGMPPRGRRRSTTGSTSWFWPPWRWEGVLCSPVCSCWVSAWRAAERERERVEALTYREPLSSMIAELASAALIAGAAPAGTHSCRRSDWPSPSDCMGSARAEQP